MKRQTIFFDFDGVLTTDRNGSTSTISALSLQLGVSQESVRDAYYEHLPELILGTKNHTEICKAMSNALQVTLDNSVWPKVFSQIPINQLVLELARSISKTHQVGIITDNPADRMESAIHQFSLHTLFDPIVVSGCTGISKRSPEIFYRALSLAGTRPQDSIFIDNTIGNLEIPRALGFFTIHHDDKLNDTALLEERLVAALATPVSAT